MSPQAVLRLSNFCNKRSQSPDCCLQGEHLKGKDARSEHDSNDADPDKGHENAATRGNEKAQEMRARRDERKAIKEEYKADSRSGERNADIDNGVVGAAVNGLMESDEESKDQEKKARKSWWKFWDE